MSMFDISAIKTRLLRLEELVEELQTQVDVLAGTVAELVGERRGDEADRG